MATIRETLLPSTIYSGVTEDEAMEKTYGLTLANLRYIDRKYTMEKIENLRRLAEAESKRKHK